MTNLLPLEIVDKIQKGLDIVPQHYESISIALVEVLNFSDFIPLMNSEDLVDKMNQLDQFLNATFSQYNISPISTYSQTHERIYASGVFEGQDVNELASLALHLVMRCPMIENETPLRVVLCSGAAISAVVGMVMPRFVLFGEVIVQMNRIRKIETDQKVGRWWG